MKKNIVDDAEADLKRSAKKQIENEKRLTVEGDDNSQSIVAISELHTLEEVLKYAKTDLDVWEVERHVINKWAFGAKLGHKGEELIRVTPLWQVKIWLKRRIKKCVEDSIELIMKRMDKHSPRYANLPKIKPVSDPHLIEISVYDPHFGKLAWKPETGTDYDLKIAEELFLIAIKDLCSKAKGFPIEQISLPLGNDFFHVDNAHNTTVNDTPQDCDGRYAKIFEVGFMACVRSIDYLLGIGPVYVPWVPGNHDRTTSFHLVRELKSHYRNTDRVEIDCSPAIRKYYSYGRTIIGYTHGKEEKHTMLPGLMAADRPLEYVNAITREWHIGHKHKENEFEIDGTNVAVITIPSITATDAWHDSKGFKNQKRAAMAFLYSKTRGASARLYSLVGETK